jgi:hypothetical protein
MLQGSPKQVSWAKRIKAERLSSWMQSEPLLFNEVEANLQNELSASWWITHRLKGLGEVKPYIVEGGERNAMAKPKVAKVSPPKGTTASKVPPKESFSGLDDVHRFVGELKDRATGELVVDSECPF